RDILGRLRSPLTVPVAIAQHMPPRFTEAFADRLRKSSALDVAEAAEGELLTAGKIRVAPGGKHLTVIDQGGQLVCKLQEPSTPDRWVPSVDVLFNSAVAACGARTLGVVLTGMGRDGSQGAKALKAAGAPLWCESPLTAAVDGMPLSAAQAHGEADRVPLD